MLDLRPYFDPATHVHTSVTAAIWEDYTSSDGYFSVAARRGAQTPFSRTDVLKAALDRNPDFRVPGKIYPSKGRPVNSLPEQLPLDYETGFAFGAYCAEGCHSTTQAVWSNNDATFTKRVTDWLDRCNVNWHTASRPMNNGTSTSTWAHSILLAKLMPELCGSLSRNKKVPDFMHVAPLECVAGFVDGYFSGDGHVSKTTILASSASETLLLGVSHLLSRFAIHTRIVPVVWKWKGERRPGFAMSIQQGDAHIFSRVFTLTIGYKQDQLDHIQTKQFPHRHHRIHDVIELEDVALEPVKSVERVPYAHKWTYDLTVARTRNMQMFNGVTTSDTFHHAGEANIGMTRGGRPG